jgi:hypothetical protein
MIINKRSKFAFFKAGDIVWIPYTEGDKFFVVKGKVEVAGTTKMVCSCNVDDDIFDITLDADENVFFTKREAINYYESKNVEFKVFEDNTLTNLTERAATITQEVSIKVGNEDGLPNGTFNGTLSKVTEANDGQGSKMYYYHGKVEGAPKNPDGTEQEFDIILTNANIHAIGSKIAEQYRIIILALNKSYAIGKKLNEQGIYDNSYMENPGFKERWEN